MLADADHRMYRDKAARRGQLSMPEARTPADFRAVDVFELASPVGSIIPPPYTVTDN